MNQRVLDFIESIDGVCRPAKAVAAAGRAFVNSWNAFKPRALRYDTGIYSPGSIVKDPLVAKFLWGEVCESLKDLDALNARFSASDGVYSICPFRFSIGAILFKRETWLDANAFPAVAGTGMGEDETYLCTYCMNRPAIIAVAENVVVGHLAFGPQWKDILAFAKERRII